MAATSQSQESTEWRDGFLFVANQTVLDLLNTRPVLDGEPRELLPNAAALERWLEASGLVKSRKAKAMVRRWRNSSEGESFVQQLTAFRERLRASVLRLEAGLLPGDAFVTEVNLLLRKYPRHIALKKKTARLVRETVFEPRSPEDVWSPIAAATADLLAEIDPSRVRKCESCVVHFHDTSKKGSRRWCSMNICGNKVKVAAYQRRQRPSAA
jgi:predicted RNA-binding Zn ribbon-like protein